MSLSADTQFRLRSDGPSAQRETAQGARSAPSSDVVSEFRRAMNPNPAEQKSAQQKGDSVDSLFKGMDRFDNSVDADKEKARKTQSRSHDLESGGLKPTDGAAQRNDSSLDALFRSFSAFGTAQQSASASAPAEAPPAQNGVLDPDNLNSLVSRILVNSPESGPAEVRLTISDSVLRGTEIAITRDLTGQLSVQILCKDPSSFQTLVASRNDLQQILQSEERQPVNISMSQEAGAEENDSRQRSRGLETDEYGNPA